MVYNKGILLKTLKTEEVNSMLNTMLMTIGLLLSILFLPVHGVTFAAEWYEMDPGQDICSEFQLAVCHDRPLQGFAA